MRLVVVVCEKCDSICVVWQTKGSSICGANKWGKLRPMTRKNYGIFVVAFDAAHLLLNSLSILLIFRQFNGFSFYNLWVCGCFVVDPRGAMRSLLPEFYLRKASNAHTNTPYTSERMPSYIVAKSWNYRKIHLYGTSLLQTAPRDERNRFFFLATCSANGYPREMREMWQMLMK